MWFDVHNTYVTGVIYRHPNNNIESFVSLLEQTINKIQKENKPYILCGDINIDLLHPDITNCQLYIDTLLSNNILPVITVPTRITDYSATVIDHINVYRPLQLLNDFIISGNILIDVSDHLLTLLILKDIPELRLNVLYSKKQLEYFISELSSCSFQNVFVKM